MKFQKSLIALFIAGTLSACGGSSGSNTSETAVDKPSSTPAEGSLTSLSGKAADGYLVGANVCLDLNNNKICDSNDPSTITGNGGTFTLKGVTQTQINENPLLVEVVADQTVDEDDPGMVLKKAYTLSAPAGYTFISPLTTMVQNKVESGNSINDAEKEVKEKLGTTLSLKEDYVAAKKEGDNTQEFEKLHQIAQVTANVIADNMAALKTTAETENIKLSELISLITNKVFDELATISQKVESIGENEFVDFKGSDIAADIDIKIEKENLVEEIKVNEATTQAKVASIIDLVKTDGLNWFWSEKNESDIELEYGFLKLNSDGSISEKEYKVDNNGTSKEWAYKTDALKKILTEDGWIIKDDTITSIVPNKNGSITLKMEKTPYLNEVLTGTELSLDGLNVKVVLAKTGGDASWSNTVSDTLSFPLGSKAYQIEYTLEHSQPSYQLDLNENCNRQNSLSPCNAVMTNGHGADTLKFLEEPGSLIDNIIVDLEDGYITMQIMEDGSVDFYKWSRETGQRTKIQAGSWDDFTIHNKTIRKILVPASIANMEGQKESMVDSKGKLYLTEFDGYVRFAYIDNDFGGDGERIFNKIANNFILDNFSRDNLPKQVTKTIVVDGLISDWKEMGIDPTIIDARDDLYVDGDGGDYGDAFDITEIYFTQDDDNLYFRVDSGQVSAENKVRNKHVSIIFKDSSKSGFSVNLSQDKNNNVDSYVAILEGWNIPEKVEGTLPFYFEPTSRYIEISVPKSLIPAIEQEYTMSFDISSLSGTNLGGYAQDYCESPSLVSFK